MQRKRSSRRNARPKKSWIQKCKDCLRQLLAFLFSNVGIICLVVGYTSAGAVMFMKIEGEGGEQNDFTSRLNKSYDETLENIWNITTSAWTEKIRQHKIDEIEANLKKFQNLIVEGVKVADYQPRVKNKWSIYAAFLYCLTVITTIGYGNIFPRTHIGKLATIVYAIFGMPLFLLYLSNIGDLLAKSFKWLYAKLCLCKLCRLRKRRALASLAGGSSGGGGGGGENGDGISRADSRRIGSEKRWSSTKSSPDTRNRPNDTLSDIDDSDDEDTASSSSSSCSFDSKDPQDVTVPISLCLAIMIGFISLGALLFGRHKNDKDEEHGLNFLDGSYFCFISLSTIGFGDITPSTEQNKDNELNFIFCSMYLMLGMALIAMCFNLMQQDVVQKIRTCTDIIRRLVRCRR